MRRSTSRLVNHLAGVWAGGLFSAGIWTLSSSNLQMLRNSMLVLAGYTVIVLVVRSVRGVWTSTAEKK